jgi:ATP-binding cassette, subfamily C, bacterial CydD
LDEPTANLDSETVEIILKQIEKWPKNKLLIVASHEEKFDAIAAQVLNLNWGEQMTYE